MIRPVIGISTYREPADWGQWRGVPATLLPARYAAAVSSGGATPVLLPPMGVADDVPGTLHRLDALVIAGGSDVNPSRYGELPHDRTAGWRDDRDVSEFALLDAAQDLGVPTLGICRGMQVMAVRAGGKLVQHVPDLVGHDRHSPGPGHYGRVEVKTEPGTTIAQILGEAVTVPCHHHQAVREHPGFAPAAYADDGLLEAMVHVGPWWAVGVQWHPETDTDLRLFQALAGMATARAEAR